MKRLIIVTLLVFATGFVSQSCPAVKNDAVAIPEMKAFNQAGRETVITLGVIHAETPAAVQDATQEEEWLSANLTAEEIRALELLNDDRKANGLPPLRINPQLTALARYYSQDMVSRNYFSHCDPEGQSPFDRMRRHAIVYRYAGENLAINTSVETAEKAFMGSQDHRANILNSLFIKVGIGVCHDYTGAVFVVQEFVGD